MKWKTGITLLLSLIVLSAFVVSIPQPSYAARTKKKLIKKDKTLRSKQKKAKQIEKELQLKKNRVKAALKKEKSILSRIEDIDREIRKKQEELKRYDKRISETKSKISGLSKEIGLLDGKLETKRKYLKERLRVLYKQQYGNYALTLISAKDYQDLIRKSKYISLVAYHDSKIVTKYKRDKVEITSKKRNMEALQSTLKTSRRIALNKEKALQTDRTKKDKLLATIRSKRSTYEKTIKELEESSRKLQGLIEKLQKQKVPRSVTGKGITASRGHLPWPINGRVLVPFGKYKDPKFKITVFKNGIEIKARQRDKPKAVAGGRVVYADWFKGYGLLLIINHGRGYHSLYGNLSEIFHKTGELINSGAAVGEVGKSRILNVPTLYFEMRYKGKPTDPLKWLKKKRKRRR
jgi:septal ring factor EnvC (AmiA/AmiB activator)